MTINRSPRQPLLTIPDSRLGKLGCGCALVIWFTILSLPCALFWFASGNEIRIPHSNAPDAYDHPLLEIGLIMTTENRGLKFKTSTIHSTGDNTVCVQTRLSYLLWETREADPSTAYCDCYERASSESAWTSTGTTGTTCGN